MGKSILVVEDDGTQASNISTYLVRQGWEVETCASAEEALDLCESMRPDCLVADQTLPRLTGIEMIERLRRADPSLKCVIMTGDDRAQTAVQAMKAGASDYIVKPIVLAELHLLLEKVVGTARLEQALQFHRERQARGANVQGLVGESPPMQQLKGTIRQVLDAEQRVTDGDLPAVLIVGETGTGKELVARAMHFDGRRKAGPFVEINCASIPANLLESELFGHEKGAFTDARERRAGLVEAADGGTLFLDEIGEIDLALQAKLLKLLEERKVRRVGSSTERKVDLRIISATNRDLESMVKQGSFRSDLYFRLRIIPIQVPPLRARGGDILLLARHFLELHARRYGKPGLQFSAAAEEVLMHYSWPGNVRELRNTLEQTVLLAPGDVITPAQLALCPGLAPDAACDRHFTGCGQPCMGVPKNNKDLARVERDLLVETLKRTGWNVSRSAKLLGLSRDMVRYRMEKMGLARPDDLAEGGPGWAPPGDFDVATSQ